MTYRDLFHSLAEGTADLFFCVIGNYSVMFLLHKNAPRGCDQMQIKATSVFCTVFI